MESGKYMGIVAQLCRTKIMKGGEIGISNAYHATKLILNQDNEEIVEFVSKLPLNEGFISFDGNQLSGSSFLTVKEDLPSPNSVFLTLHALQTVDVVSYAKGDNKFGGKELTRFEAPVDVDFINGREAVFKIIVENKHFDGRDNVYVVDMICGEREMISKNIDRQTMSRLIFLLTSTNM